ncbi:MAG: hypothetical protein KDA28_06980, partial [Phycisphaerales bacterium]|nr:hypothetical protein [Phycisphaerales bacterium]
MKKIITYVVAGVLIVALLSYMVTYTVRFNETAVKTSFGRTSQLKTEAGLDFMIPIKDSITKYDTRIRLLKTRTETQQTADNKQITVDAFCMWRVSDPGKFFEKFSNAGNRAVDHFDEAESTLTSRLRSSMGAVSRYALDELFTLGADTGRIRELEASIRDAMRTADESGGSVLDYGIEIVDVGINRVGFPEKNSEAVFALMTASRDRLAKELESEGTSRAQTIRSVADAKSKKILNFAENFANRIRAEG